MSSPRDFLYVRIQSPDRTVFYRIDDDAPPAGRVRRLDDGVWQFTEFRSAGEFLSAARSAGHDPVAVEEGDVPCGICMIFDGTATAEIVYRWDDALAIAPRPAPCTPGHVLIVPREHVRSAKHNPTVAGMIAQRAGELAAILNLPAYNYINSYGKAASNKDPHLHGHLVPREPGDRLAMPWTRQLERDVADDLAALMAQLEPQLSGMTSPADVWFWLQECVRELRGELPPSGRE